MKKLLIILIAVIALATVFTNAFALHNLPLQGSQSGSLAAPVLASVSPETISANTNAAYLSHNGAFFATIFPDADSSVKHSSGLHNLTGSALADAYLTDNANVDDSVLSPPSPLAPPSKTPSNGTLWSILIFLASTYLIPPFGAFLRSRKIRITNEQLEAIYSKLYEIIAIVKQTMRDATWKQKKDEAVIQARKALSVKDQEILLRKYGSLDTAVQRAYDMRENGITPLDQAAIA